MVHLYEKVCKTDNNKYGIKEIQGENPFKEGPCIITILALTAYLEDINGFLKYIAPLVNPDINTHYDPDRRLFGLGFGDFNEKYQRFSRVCPNIEEIEEFLNTYFYPLFIDNNKRIDTISAMKNFRNLTFVTYCNGANYFKLIEEKLKSKMQEVGYTNSDINMILSQICLAAISGETIKKNGTSTLAITFGDVNDYDYENDKKTKEDIKKLKQGFIDYDSSLGFAVAGDGGHSVRKHVIDNDILSSKIKIFLNTSIDNALENRNNDIINPITYEKLEKSFNNTNNKTKSL